MVYGITHSLKAKDKITKTKAERTTQPTIRQRLIPAERMKKRKEHLIPLPHQAVTLLKGMHTLSGTKKHLFPHRDDRTKPMVTASFRQMLNVLGWSGKFSPHATRTSGSTRLNEMGYSPDWIERQLAHLESNSVRAAYNYAECLPERRKMMQEWSDYLTELKEKR